eukprot:CAMPEP_0184656452 /NCGR_PEP_ID=MMETSP0308-20130426/16516_1 /TAXON_ID=38269 /ORGANISM="Gloeochaete witrockiana, Strain SAG 46.84" /LENGTH=263 /DNA_ID=CAMNT_0027093593 /DNA_START=144 /DNA_END=935 /DNA_ORIENTATION=-
MDDRIPLPLSVPHHRRSKFWRSMFLLVVVFLSAMSVVWFALSQMPRSEEIENLKIPRTIQELKEAKNVLSKYTTDYYYSVMFGIFILYVFLQAFAIPGSLMLTVLAGALFGFTIGLTLVLLSATIGASFCFLLSYLFGRPVIHRFFHQRLVAISQKVHEQQQYGNLFSLVLFLRISPVVPSWFINISSPVLEIPYWIFAPATFIGISPLCIIAVHAGLTLSEIETPGDILSLRTIAFLFVVALVALVPAIVRQYLSKSRQIRM